jgi:CRISPR/Cas system-associated exonuclease Cas4 (RecB family)
VKPIKINPSSAAWANNGVVVTDYSQGCLRHLIFKNYFPKPSTITPELQEMGAKGEDMYFDTLMNEQEYPFHKELAFRDEFEGVQRSGRCDYISYHDGFRVIHEIKSSQSKNTLYKVINKGEVNINHLAQLVFYLVYFNEIRGKLVVQYMPKFNRRIFKVTINEYGEVLVDGWYSGYSVENQIEHQLLSAKVIRELPKVIKPIGKACTYCDYKDICEEYEQADTTLGEFLNIGG